jgi:hypothetical protein
VPELQINDLCLVEIGGQYEYGIVEERSASGLIVVRTISGGIVGGTAGSLNIIKPTGAEAGYADALEWAAEFVDDNQS